VSAAVAYRVVLGCVPDAEIGPNGRLHPMARARKVRQLREFVGWSARESAPAEPMTGPVVLRIAVGWPKGRRRHDDDNLVGLMKAVVDGMTDAGWWRNDRQVTIARPIEQQRWTDWRENGGWLYPAGCMTIDIEEVTE
jgi:Holliday junction resolvase RusA-like endonuclease